MPAMTLAERLEAVVSLNTIKPRIGHGFDYRNPGHYTGFTSRYVTDGVVAIRLRAMRKQRAQLLDKLALIIEPCRGKADAHLDKKFRSSKSDVCAILGVTHGEQFHKPVAIVYEFGGQWAAPVNARKLLWLWSVTGSDQLFGKRPGEPLVLCRDNKSVAIICPMNTHHPDLGWWDQVGILQHIRASREGQDAD